MYSIKKTLRVGVREQALKTNNEEIIQKLVTKVEKRNKHTQGVSYC